MNKMLASRHEKGFTLIELLIVIAIIGLISTLSMVGVQNAAAARRDVKRVADAKTIQQAMSLYIAKMQSYVTYTGCINGSDAVTVGLRAEGMITPTTVIADPANPSNIASCYYYISANGSNYTLRYTLEKSSNAGQAGNNLVSP